MAEKPFNVQEIQQALAIEVADIMRDDAVRIVTAVVLGTPVGNPVLWLRPAPPGYVGGQARANWNVTIAFENDGWTENIDPAGSATIGAASAQIETYDDVDVESVHSIFIQNAVPYIVPLNNGHSSQAPAGFIEMSAQAALQPIPAKELP